MRWALAIFLVFACTTQPRADEASEALQQTVSRGPVELTVRVSAAESMVAEPFSLRFEVQAPLSYSVTLPFAQEDSNEPPLLGPFTVIAVENTERLPVDGDANRRIWASQLMLETYQVGDLEIPSLEAVFRINQSAPDDPRSQRTIRSTPIPIRINSVLQEDEVPTSFRDIKGAEEIPVEVKTTQRWWAVVAVCLAIVAVYWFRRPSVSPAQVAHLAIDETESAWNEKSIEISQAYASLSTTLRRYFDLQLNIAASSMSVNELTSALSDLDVADSTIKEVAHFFGESDQIKFSGRLKLDSSHDKTPFDAVRKIVRETCDLQSGGKN